MLTKRKINQLLSKFVSFSALFISLLVLTAEFNRSLRVGLKWRVPEHLGTAKNATMLKYQTLNGLDEIPMQHSHYTVQHSPDGADISLSLFLSGSHWNRQAGASSHGNFILGKLKDGRTHSIFHKYFIDGSKRAL